ncbi:unnamed protein product [Protopolystoma xenopodis]|uniref:Uncharacterized protein n=1 Tax=Protopolystoma xenopodis TaxID=117903 RepID=A0A448WPG7_9PLAT|nr:unnamed protein product [Protopolystoma xenopodis]
MLRLSLYPHNLPHVGLNSAADHFGLRYRKEMSSDRAGLKRHDGPSQPVRLAPIERSKWAQLKRPTEGTGRRRNRRQTD